MKDRESVGMQIVVLSHHLQIRNLPLKFSIIKLTTASGTKECRIQLSPDPGTLLPATEPTLPTDLKDRIPLQNNDRSRIREARTSQLPTNIFPPDKFLNTLPALDQVPSCRILEPTERAG